MSVIVRDDGFHAEDYTGEAVLDIAQDTRPDALPESFDGVDLVRVAFPAASDGRGFSLARQLRARGYAGRLRAKGHVIADQYAMARRCGFDEVEISDDLAARQPAEQWIFRADWQEHDYRARLKA
ncbi:DUF934 domain-containing protein [Defluviimonas sp. WL0024]|uniref:DUF934 domain-containing protein n=2 Tax=Albidovulum TaxID=205889 RepID=A0ABT3IZK1_9RHOB|nr:MULTISPECIES: DUF934 domain-containing protein [Defluviimonas]MCU9849771.1 DUF934 domain-containing protein [Defluviimonas sp. WL0024]MCW3780859.1 DUF934 domain-containing protein [Defluviimonas salinarum]